MGLNVSNNVAIQDGVPKHMMRRWFLASNYDLKTDRNLSVNSAFLKSQAIKPSAPISDRHVATLIHDWVDRQIKYKSEIKDKWQTPEQTIARRAGDCEDHAILKYVLLQIIGRGKHIYCVLVKDTVRNVDHMVMVLQDGTEHIMFDIGKPPIRLRDWDAAGYRPIFSFNHQGGWLHGEKKSVV